MFQWTYEDNVVSSNAVLLLNNVQRNQTGVYTCTTANVVGTASADITLTVQCEWKGREGRRGEKRGSVGYKESVKYHKEISMDSY